MRIAFFALLFLNLAYFAWARWIDQPAPVQAAPSLANVPRLVLASEASQSPSRPGDTQGTASGRCISVGPFNAAAHAASAAGILSSRGLTPRQRAEVSETREGYWVYIGGLKSALEEARVMRALDQAKLSDAQIMSGPENAGRVSVGLFSDRTRAERRAHVLERLGFKPEIGERRMPGTVYWLDLTLPSDDRTVSTEGLGLQDERASHLEVRTCPGAPAQAQ